MGSQNKLHPPVVDFTKENLKPGSSSWCSVRDNVKRALEDYGFFVALYDKVSLELHEAIFRASKEVFDLPIEIKSRITSDEPYHGYFGQVPSRPLIEGIGIPNSTNLESAQSFTSLLWPNGNHKFWETAVLFARIVAELDNMVTRMLFEGYGVEKYYGSHIGSTTYLLRMLKYRAPKMNEDNTALRPHTDKSFFTILHQNQVHGLRVKTKDGEWIDVEFPPSSFVVMAGDGCMGWSNDRISSPHHQVIMNGGNETRYSIALFSFAGKMIKTPGELVDDENPLRYKPFNQVDLLKFYHTKVGVKAHNTLQAYCGL